MGRNNIIVQDAEFPSETYVAWIIWSQIEAIVDTWWSQCNNVDKKD